MYHRFQLIKYLFALLFVFQNIMLHAQPPMGTAALWSELEQQIQKGNKRALRDLGTFLDKPDYANATRQALIRYTFFTKNEINLSTASREDFLGFYYDNESHLKFSEILQAFYRTPIEEQSLDTTLFKVQIIKKIAQVAPSVKRALLAQKFDSLCLEKQKSIEIQAVIEEICALGTPGAYDWLRRTLASEPFGKSYDNAYLSMCEGLKTDPSLENLQAILKAVERGLVHPELLSAVFLDLTNIAVVESQARHLLDSLGTLEAIRAYGYDRSLTFKESFFYEKVDYYGKILSNSNVPHWVQRNALHDLLETHNPRLLFFLAAQVRLKPNEKDEYTKLLQKLTNNGLVYTLTNNKTTDVEEIEQWKNYVHWWAIHQDDFEWDNTSERFLSHSEMVERTEEIERLVRRLGSSNDSVAMAAFKQLTENDPSIVTATMEKFRPLLRSYNVHLPEINYPFLEYMTQFTAYCRENKISLNLTHGLDSLLMALSSTNVPSKRYSIENQCIEMLELKDVSALEYYGLLYSSDLDMNFSVSRMLDIFYSKHWEEVISENTNLSLYIKKSILFKRIGTGGTCGLYDRKLDIKNELLRERLTKIARTEGDSNIRNFILTRLNPLTTLKNEDNNGAKSFDKKELSIAEKVKKLEAATEISIDEINDFVLDSTYSSEFKPQLIDFLKKVAPLSSLRRFKLKYHLTVSNDLKMFSDMVIGQKDLDDFLGVFKADLSPKDSLIEQGLWLFIHKQTARYSIDEHGSFWNDMFKVAWFNNLIHSNTIQSSQKDTIVFIMRNYLSNSEFLSEFEEQMTQIHISELGNIGRSLTEKLTSTLELEANSSIKWAVQSAILARIQYEDIGIVATFWEQKNLNTVKEASLTFLQTDFGIPLFSSDKATIMLLIENHKKMSPKAFYCFYLKQFGLNLWNTEGGLNYETIYEALTHESVMPFTGGGTQRDYFTYGIIKLLEFEFDTRLGFHEKLNENQTFYTFNTSKRATAWRAFLIEKKLVKMPPSVPPSFKS
jgi:hypothetical protein